MQCIFVFLSISTTREGNDRTGEGDLPEITNAAAGGDTLVVAGAQENREQEAAGGRSLGNKQ